ncbi:dual specificity phosphatase, catalytic domain protein [Oesophagostomum dentatum]|uniref:Dual specificity phosphatase, catalytic domain protein n=1 Tax=Oesophagostomum dentatum TaxID=61180 RepID=A0A0B1T5C9_OESDE|nr:dual specificity phosphatase, catalytic domain protein [Oesophagostomum dentatum]
MPFLLQWFGLITDNILAMARPQPIHFENDVIIYQFKKSNIVAVFNLEEPGEHAFCGTGNLVCGFSYDPERFMENNIFHYNFPLPDFEACLAERMADIVTVMVHELRKGKIAVHCHAGHGRTGTVIAACLMRTRGLSPREAVDLVRSKRPSSVQSGEQVRALHSLHDFLSTSAPVLPAQPFASTSQYIEYASRILPKKDQRKYGKVPKPLFVSVVALLRLFFTSITLKLEIAVGHLSCFHFECQDSTSYK